MSRRNKTARPSILRAAPRTQNDYVLAQPVPVAPPYTGQATSGIPEAFEIRVQVLTDPHATVAKAVFMDSMWQPVYTATGSSRTEPGDVYDPEVGTALAVSRALYGLARKLGRQANGLVRHAESNRKQNALRDRTLPVVSGYADVRQDGDSSSIVLHLRPGQTPDDVPGEVSKMLATMWPGTDVEFVTDLSDDIPAEIAKALGEFLEQETREHPGKHAKGEGDNAPIDPDLLEQG